jgi:hypothetical protein
MNQFLLNLLPLLVLFVASILHQSVAIGTVQSTAVKGTLLCNGKPSVGTKVKLYDHDSEFCIYLIPESKNGDMLDFT